MHSVIRFVYHFTRGTYSCLPAGVCWTGVSLLLFICGNLEALFQMPICVGVLLVYLLGTYISYWQLAFVCTAFSAVQLVLMLTIRESPRLSRNPLKNIRAQRSKRQSDSVGATCGKDMTVKARTTSQQQAFVNFPKSYVPRILIVVILLVFQAITGVDAIASLAGPIFRAAGLDSSSISSGLLASLTVGVVLIVFTILSFFVVDRFGRRIPLFFGGLALAVADMGMVVYFTDAFGFVSSPGSGN